MRRGRYALVVAAMMAAGGQAFAQTPVEGGGDFAQAPILAPGAYADSIRLRETLFYAVELAAGQSVRATATVRGAGDNPTPAIVALDLTVFNPLREEAARDSTVMTGPARRVRLGVRGETVGGADPSYGQAGVYFLVVSMTPFRGEFQDVEYPVELEIEVSGAATPVPGPTATASMDPPSPEITTVEERAETRGSGWRLSELAVFGLLGLLAGGVLGAFGMSRFRR